MPSARPARPLPTATSNGSPTRTSTRGRNRRPRRRAGAVPRQATGTTAAPEERDQPGRALLRTVHVARPASALGEDADHPACLEHADRGRPTGSGRLRHVGPGSARSAAALGPRAPEELLLDQEAPTGAADSEEQLAVDHRAVVGDDHAAGRSRAPAPTRARDAERGPVEPAADPARRSRAARATVPGGSVCGHRSRFPARAAARSPRSSTRSTSEPEHALDVQVGRVDLDGVVGAGAAARCVRLESSRSRRSTSRRVVVHGATRGRTWRPGGPLRRRAGVAPMRSGTP